MTLSLACRRLVSLAVIATGLGAIPSVQAALLTPAYEAQLEAWLGQGDLNLTNIYTKASGDDSIAFRTAVHNQGPTFTLINIYGSGLSGNSAITSQIIGGYNPFSWLSSGAYNYTTNREAFIFNLTTGARQNQSVGELGNYQTVNGGAFGPTFGGGHDIYVNSTLGAGYANNFSYGDTIGGAEIVSGTPNSGNLFEFSVADIEVYTFAPAAPQGVPDPAGTFALIGASFLGLAALRRRR